MPPALHRARRRLHPPRRLAVSRLGPQRRVCDVHRARRRRARRSLRTARIDAEGGRAVVGKSSGGFGAMHLALEHPGTFGAFASHSGDSYFRYAHPPAFATVHRIARSARLRYSRVRRGVRTEAQAQHGRIYDDGDARLRGGVFAAERDRLRSRSALRPSYRRAARRRLRALARVRSGRADRDASCAADAGYACAISTAGGATSITSTSARASSRSASATSAFRCATRNSTTTTATSDTGTKYRCRRSPPSWTRNDERVLSRTDSRADAFSATASAQVSAADAVARSASLYAIRR